MNLYDYFNEDGTYKIRIIAKSWFHQKQLFNYAFSGTKLTYDDWLLYEDPTWLDFAY